MLTATTIRILFFGTRYLSLLWVARMLGPKATGFLLAVAITELMRIAFDYGLENALLSRTHQGNSDLDSGLRKFRLIAIIVGQALTTAILLGWARLHDVSYTIILVTSLQFACLMGFGYFQACMQTDEKHPIKILLIPLCTVVLIQIVLLYLTHIHCLPLVICCISFELLSCMACIFVLKKSDVLCNYVTPITLPGTLKHLAPLGNVALIGLVYTRIDALALSLIHENAQLLTQYLYCQRLASAPLMLFSTVANVNIARLAKHGSHACEHSKILKFRRIGILVGLLAATGFWGGSFWINKFNIFLLTSVPILIAQTLVLGLQVANGFSAASLIATQESRRLWRIARNNTILALCILPLATWRFQTLGIAAALLFIECYCFWQHHRAFVMGIKPESVTI